MYLTIFSRCRAPCRKKSSASFDFKFSSSEKNSVKLTRILFKFVLVYSNDVCNIVLSHVTT